MNLEVMNKFNSVVVESLHEFYSIVKDYEFIDHLDTSDDGAFNHWDTYHFISTPYRLYFQIELIEEDAGEEADLIFSIEASADPDLRDFSQFSNFDAGISICEMKLKEFLIDGTSIDDELNKFCIESAEKAHKFLKNHLKVLLIQLDNEAVTGSFKFKNHEWLLDWLNYDTMFSFAGVKYEEIMHLLTFLNDDSLSMKYIPQNVKDIFIF